MKLRTAGLVVAILAASVSCKKAAAPAPRPTRAVPVAKQPLPHPLFWAVEKDGKTTYVLGTMHMGVDPDARIPELVWRKLDEAPAFAMETDLSKAASLDVMAINTYNGWYGPDRLQDLAKIEWHVPQDKPLLFSETGAAALAGLHRAEHPGKFSEEYQAEYYRQTLAWLSKIPNFDGLSPWILKDFRSPRRQLPGIQDGWNRKGLVSETGQRKLAFGVLADWYQARANTP